MYRRIIAGLFASLALILAGCQSLEKVGESVGLGGTSSGLDPRLKNSESAQFFSKSGLQACAAGAGAGAVACLASGNVSTGCMLVAAAAGCGVGMGANYYLDFQRTKYAKVEERLDAAIADARKDNQALQSLAKTARQVIADDRKKIAKIRQDIAKKRVQEDLVKKQLAEIDANTAYLKKALAGVQDKQAQWEKVAQSQNGAGGSRLKALNVEISRIKTQKAQLEKEIDQLYAQRTAIKLA